MGALIPLAVPFLQGDNAVGAIGLITALALSSSIVDSSQFSTSVRPVETRSTIRSAGWIGCSGDALAAQRIGAAECVRMKP